MSLPQIKTPEFLTQLPSTGEKIAFRPFLVKEEKILLMAQQGKDESEIMRAVYGVLESCVKTPITISELPIFDVEWLFLQLRAKSVSEEIKLNLKHQKKECGHTNEVYIDIKDIEVSKPEENSHIIDIDGNIGITMKYPTLNMLDPKKFKEAGEGLEVQEIFELLRKCVVNVFDKDQVYNDFTPEELNAFLEGLGQNQFLRISDFFQKVPKVRHKVSFKCAKCGEPVEYNLEGLMDFFL